MSPPQGAVFKEYASILSIKQTGIWLCGLSDRDETERLSSHSHLFLTVPCSHQKSGFSGGTAPFCHLRDKGGWEAKGKAGPGGAKR